METNQITWLRAAARAASRVYDSDDYDLLWEETSGTIGPPATPVSDMRGVEGVEGGFWVDARVWVSDDDVGQSVEVVERPPDLNAGVDAALRQSRRDREKLVDEMPESPDDERRVPPKFESQAEYLTRQLQESEAAIRQSQNDAKEPAVYFGPQEIKDHFDEDPSEIAAWVLAQERPMLLKVGKDAVADDRVWETFHEVLVSAATDAYTNLAEDARVDALLEEDARIKQESKRAFFESKRDGDARAISVLADAVNQLAMMLEESEYARTTGLRVNTAEFVTKQRRLREIRERVAPMIPE